MNPHTAARARRIVWFTVAVDLLGLGLILPMKPFYAEAFGASAAAVTWLTASYAGAQLLFAPLWGRLADRVGRRPVIIASSLVAAAGYLGFACAESLAALFVARFISGIGSANIAAAHAVIADTTPAVERSRELGRLGAAFGVGFILGPLLGGALVQLGVAVPPLAAMVLTGCNALVAAVALPETRPLRRLGHQRPAPSRHRTSLWLPLLGVVLATKLAMSLVEQTVALFVERAHAGGGLEAASALTAVVLVAVGLTAALVQTRCIGPLVGRWGDRGVLARGAAIAGVAVALVPFAGHDSFGWFAALLTLQAVGTSLMLPTTIALLTRETPPIEVGGVLGRAQALSAGGRLVGPLVAGPLFLLSPDAPWLVAAVVFAGVAGATTAFTSAPRAAFSRAEVAG